MKTKRKKNSRRAMRSEYDFSGGVRGKYATQFSEKANVIVLAPDVAKAFPDSDAVNAALRLLVKLARVSRRDQMRSNGRSRSTVE